MGVDIDRLSPDGKNDYLSQQHLARYDFVQKNYTFSGRVLDVACGTGYGTMMLKNAGFDIIGVDIDAEQIKENQRVWGEERFNVADVMNLPYEDDSFDAVVSFETIEHVYDGEAFFKEVKRVLKPGGIIICSTPNIKYTAHPEFHLKEYTPDEFYNLASKYFEEVKSFAQYFRYVDRVRDKTKWVLTDAIVRTLTLLQIKNLIKNILNSLKKTSSNEVSERDGEIGAQRPMSNIRDVKIDAKYGVTAFSTEELLRIMLVVGKVSRH